MAQIESFNSYIFRMAKNSALNYLKHLEIKSRYEIRRQPHENRLSMEEEIDAKDLETAIRSVVENMPAQRKKVFDLSRDRHLKNKEIMDILNISEKTVKNHLTLALKDIKKAIFTFIVIFSHFN